MAAFGYLIIIFVGGGDNHPLVAWRLRHVSASTSQTAAAMQMFCTTSKCVCSVMCLCFLHPVSVCAVCVPPLVCTTCMCVFVCVCVCVRERERERERKREREREREILRYLASLLPLFVWLRAFRLSVRGLCSETKHAVISVTSLAAGTQHTPQRDKTPWHSLRLTTFWLQQLTLRTKAALGILESYETLLRWHVSSSPSFFSICSSVTFCICKHKYITWGRCDKMLITHLLGGQSAPVRAIRHRTDRSHGDKPDNLGGG